MNMFLKRLGAATLVGVCLSATMTDAFAQRERRAPRGERGSEAPKAETPPAEAAAPAGQGGGPQRIELQPSQASWTKVCGKDQASGREVCYTTRDFGQGADQPPVLALAVYDVKGTEKRVMRMLLPVALLLRPGFRFSVDQGPAAAGAFAICFPNGCFAEAEIGSSILSSMKKGTTLNVSVRNQAGGQVDFALALAGFGKSFDGPPIDPKILEKQQKAIKDQIELQQKQAKEQLELKAKKLREDQEKAKGKAPQQ